MTATHVYALPMKVSFRGITIREGMLIEGSAGWGDFCPFPEYDDVIAARWLAAAREAAFEGWPKPVRERVPVNCIVPVVSPEKAHEMVKQSECGTAKVKVANNPDSIKSDMERLEAVRDALGSDGAIRVDINAAWDLDTARRWLPVLNKAAGGLEYAEQPCRELEDLVTLRRLVNVPIAVDESIRLAPDPLQVRLAGLVDVAVLKPTTLGGVRRSLQVAEAVGVPCVVSSALESSVGLAACLAFAAALPELPYACGLGTAVLFEKDVVREDDVVRPEDGFLRVRKQAPMPGTALLNAAKPEPTRVKWWEERFQRLTSDEVFRIA